jgi:hypothetical protein
MRLAQAALLLAILGFARPSFATDAKKAPASWRDDLAVTINCQPLKRCQLTITNTSKTNTYTHIQVEVFYGAGMHKDTAALDLEGTVPPQSKGAWTIGIVSHDSTKYEEDVDLRSAEVEGAPPGAAQEPTTQPASDAKNGPEVALVSRFIDEINKGFEMKNGTSLEQSKKLMKFLSPEFFHSRNLDPDNYLCNMINPGKYEIASVSLPYVDIRTLEGRITFFLRFKVTKEGSIYYLRPSRVGDKYVDPWWEMRRFSK